MTDSSNNTVIDFAEYKSIRNQEQNVDLVAAFEEFVKAEIQARPLEFLRDMGKLRDALDAIREASRLPIPALFNNSLPPRPTFETINVPKQDYDRLQRMLSALKDAEKTIYE